MSSALETEGLLILGGMDASEAPPWLSRIGPAELHLFTRSRVSAPAAGADPVKVPPRAPPSPRKAEADACISEHVRALGHIERGQHRSAETILRQLQARHPRYLPAVLERALLFAREGDKRRARELMREVLSLASQVDEGAPVAGPEPLPLSYYRSSAEAFLERDAEEP